MARKKTVAGKSGRKPAALISPGRIDVRIGITMAKRARAYAAWRNIELATVVEDALRDRLRGFLPDVANEETSGAPGAAGESAEAA